MSIKSINTDHFATHCQKKFKPINYLIITIIISTFRVSLFNQNSNMFGYLIRFLRYLKWAFNLLLHFSFFGHRINAGEQLVNIWEDRFELGSRAEAVECAVCLSHIEEGEETRELSCHHLFHAVCLDTWISNNYAICPVCHDSIAPSRWLTGHGEEVIVLKFRCFNSRTERDTWWLR